MQLPSFLIAVLSTILMILVVTTSYESFYLLIFILTLMLLSLSHYYILLIIPLTFLLIPKPARELGVVALGLFLASPDIRMKLGEDAVMRLFLLSLVLILLINQKPRKLIARTIWLITSVVVSLTLAVIDPIAILLIPAYIMSFPRDVIAYMYSLLVSLGIGVLYEYSLYHFPTPGLELYNGIFIPLLLVSYSIFEGKSEVLKKKQTMFMLILSILMVPFIGTYSVEFTFLLSILSVRLAVSLRPAGEY
ncbi:hypothetical protein PNA2_1226 [Pyrococcus sp. NA2]|nr:hypothetical protein [Pyrococcus sp. NA2]AEC52141.1 hypothetical protein PNA2_1226 [Pyrococcus sp. NA2]